mmetsp:Transcript_1122/g.2395  ORF Transcript_1122/g.2395 Transcript_1122/m.2395 type:complete len:209 (-) Transcript_1122:90-716(-)
MTLVADGRAEFAQFGSRGPSHHHEQTAYEHNHSPRDHVEEAPMSELKEAGEEVKRSAARNVTEELGVVVDRILKLFDDDFGDETPPFEYDHHERRTAHVRRHHHVRRIDVKQSVQEIQHGGGDHEYPGEERHDLEGQRTLLGHGADAGRRGDGVLDGAAGDGGGDGSGGASCGGAPPSIVRGAGRGGAAEVAVVGGRFRHGFRSLAGG